MMTTQKKILPAGGAFNGSNTIPILEIKRRTMHVAWCVFLMIGL
jgi:hypothetical protein